MKQLYRASLAPATGVADGLDHYSRQATDRSASLILADSQSVSQSNKHTTENSVSTTYEFARDWTINIEGVNTFSGKVIRPEDRFYSIFLILRCIIRFIIFEFSIFGATFARIFTSYYLARHDEAQWT
eukprot:36964_1